MTGACVHRDDAGPWVLGALDESDSDAFLMHLQRCADCRAEVAELQVVADVLPMAAPQVVPPPELKSRIMAVVESEAQLLRAAGPEADRVPAPKRAAGSRFGWLGRLRPVPAAVLATTLLAIGVIGGVLASSGGTDVVTHQGTGPVGTQVALHVSDGSRGELDLRNMPSAPAGKVYEVWLVTGNDKPRATHTLFTVPADGRARVEIMESVKDTDKVLVTAEPPGGSKQPTSNPLVGASLT
jgi:anti-sigma-K factor RskA